MAQAREEQVCGVWKGFGKTSFRKPTASIASGYRTGLFPELWANDVVQKRLLLLSYLLHACVGEEPLRIIIIKGWR